MTSFQLTNFSLTADVQLCFFFCFFFSFFLPQQWNSISAQSLLQILPLQGLIKWWHRRQGSALINASQAVKHYSTREEKAMSGRTQSLWDTSCKPISTSPSRSYCFPHHHVLEFLLNLHMFYLLLHRYNFHPPTSREKEKSPLPSLSPHYPATFILLRWPKTLAYTRKRQSLNLVKSSSMVMVMVHPIHKVHVYYILYAKKS